MKDDIIRMAREAGFTNPEKFTTTDENLKGILSDFWENLERFANLVAAAERKKVAAWMIQRGYATGHGDTIEDLLKELEWQIAERIAAEREACAKVCEDVISGIGAFYPEYVNQVSKNVCTNFAAAIRARGNT